jgi:hypothetical protein
MVNLTGCLLGDLVPKAQNDVGVGLVSKHPREAVRESRPKSPRTKVPAAALARQAERGR